MCAKVNCFTILLETQTPPQAIFTQKKHKKVTALFFVMRVNNVDEKR
jgi:hypothetical protein